MIHTASQHRQKETSFFSIRNKMITSFAVFAVSILTVVYIVAIYFASASLLDNTEYFLKELVKSSSKVLDERSQALFGKLEAFSNLPVIQILRTIQRIRYSGKDSTGIPQEVI